MELKTRNREVAASRGDGVLIKLLLDRGADIDIKGRDFDTTLQAASAGCHVQIVWRLLENGADVNTGRNALYRTVGSFTPGLWLDRPVAARGGRRC